MRWRASGGTVGQARGRQDGSDVVACCAGTNVGSRAWRPGTLSDGLSSNRGCKRVDVGGVPYVPFPSTNCISPSFFSFSSAPWSVSSSGGVARCARNSGPSVKKLLAGLAQREQCSQGSPWTHCSPPLHGCRASERAPAGLFTLVGEWSLSWGAPVGGLRYISLLSSLKAEYDGGVLYVVSEMV